MSAMDTNYHDYRQEAAHDAFCEALARRRDFIECDDAGEEPCRARYLFGHYSECCFCYPGEK